MHTRNQPIQLRPIGGQPGTVHEIAEHLLPAYTVDGGTMQLAGCRIEDRVFVRVGLWTGAVRMDVYLDAEGRNADPRLVEQLGLSSAVEFDDTDRRRWNLDHLRKVGAVHLARHMGEAPDEGDLELAVIWCKHARGKVRCTIGEKSIETAFDDWAHLLKAPPLICPETGVETYHVAMTDDGRIIAAEELAVCEATGQRVPACETVVCEATGRRVVQSVAAECPVTGQCVHQDAMVECSMCAQDVSPSSIRHGKCEACRSLRPISVDEAPLSVLLEHMPSLRSWRKWRAARTKRHNILLASGWVKRMLFVLDAETLEPVRTVSSRRLFTHWTAETLDWSGPSGIPPTHFLRHEDKGETSSVDAARERA